MNMDIQALRAQWSDVLDQLERIDRMAWIAFFDARLAKLDGLNLYLDFSDSRKFSGNLDYATIHAHLKTSLQMAIKEVTGAELDVVDEI